MSATITLQAPSSVLSSSLSLVGTWYVRHSTREIWHERRNVQVEGSAVYQNPGQPLTTLQFSYQEQNNPKVHNVRSTGWRVLGKGKDGKLESWMRETEYGIDDTAGEVRGDWRARWIALYFPPTDSMPAGIDILSNREVNLEIETIENIQKALAQLEGEHEELRNLASGIFKVAMDAGRQEELKERALKEREKWEKRSGAQEGISPDLYYDDDDDKKHKCIVM